MSKKIKIVHLIPGLSSMGGAETIVSNLCRFIDHTRFSVDVLYWTDEDELVARINSSGAKAHRLHFKKVISVASVRQIAAVLKQLDADILHTHLIDSDFLGFFASRLAGVSMIAHIHSYPYPATRRHALRYRWMSRGIKTIVCVSGHVRDHFRRMTQIPESRFQVIYNGINREQFIDQSTLQARQALKRTLGFGKDDFIVGNVSRLIPDKGHEFLLKAALTVLTRRPEIKFLIVGEGPLRLELEALSRRLGVAENVVFAGQRRDIPALLACMDVFVFPTFAEAFGLSVLEAMAAGRPIIATNDAAVPELITSGTEGVLIPPGDEKLLAQAILGLIGTPAQAGSMARAAFVRSEKFSVKAMVTDFQALYETVAKP